MLLGAARVKNYALLDSPLTGSAGEEREKELTYIVKFASFDSLTVSDRRCIIYCAANNARFDFPSEAPSCNNE